MKKSMKVLVSVLLIAILVFGVVQFCQLVEDNAEALDNYTKKLALSIRGKNDEAQLSGSVEIPDEAVPAGNAPEDAAALLASDPHVQALMALDLDAMKAVNSEVIGWILIPNTNINIPLMQGDDNGEYMYHTWDHQLNSEGSVFMDSTSDTDFSNFNTIIYGQNATEISVFYDLQKYRHQMFWDANPYVYIRTANTVYRFEVFSSYFTDVESAAYGLEFTGDDARLEFVNLALENSVISTHLIPDTTGQFLTLSTRGAETEDTRWVVQACLNASVEIGK